MISPMRTKQHTLLIVFVVMVVALLSGCSNETSTSLVAATVDGQEILEQQITDDMQTFREDMDLTDDAAWKTWMKENEQTAEGMREETINNQIRNIIIEKAAKEKNITVTDEDVENKRQEEIAAYESEEKFESTLAEMGFTDESYRKYLKDVIVQDKLKESFDVNVTEQDLLDTINNYTSMLKGAQELEILALDKNDSVKAEEAKRLLDDNDNNLVTVAQQLSVFDRYYRGWDLMIPIDTSVEKKVSNMEKGDVSDIITGKSELYIVRVLDVCHVEEDGFSNLEQVPTTLKEAFDKNSVGAAQTDAFEEYIQELTDESDIVINDMPDGLPYDVE